MEYCGTRKGTSEGLLLPELCPFHHLDLSYATTLGKGALANPILILLILEAASALFICCCFLSDAEYS